VTGSRSEHGSETSIAPQWSSIDRRLLACRSAGAEEPPARYRDAPEAAVTDDSRCEARLALTLEARGLLYATVTRPRWGEAEDGAGQIWDFKAPRSRAPIAHTIAQKAAIGGRAAPAIPSQGYPGEFNVQVEVRRAIGQQQIGKGVVFDLRRLTVDQARQLVGAVSLEPQIDPALVRFFPNYEDLYEFEAPANVN
jgi:hypothetical protein